MVIKSIRTYFLLLAALVSVAHMVIPRDHHLAGQVNGLNDSCHLSHEKSHHHPFFPAHCSAFNDLAAEKLSPLIVKQETQTSFTTIIWHPDCFLPGLHFTLKVIDNSGKPFLEIYIPDFSPFRAPPCLS
jgi:hypothetical protein